MKNSEMVVVCCVCGTVIKGTKTEGGLVSHGYCLKCYREAIEKLTEKEEQKTRKGN